MVVPRYPRTVRVALVHVYRDTLTQGMADVNGSPGISQDFQNYFGVPKYSDTGGGWCER